MQLHTLSPKTKQKKKKRIGRGGKRGTFSGRGTKGQKARAGHRIRPEIRDLLKKIPKQRGRGMHVQKSIVEKPFVVNLSDIAKVYKAGETVTPETLYAKKILRKQGKGFPSVKILGDGAVSVALSIAECTLSLSARKKIEAAGGTIAT